MRSRVPCLRAGLISVSGTASLGVKVMIAGRGGGVGKPET